jgi:hypothetical protein
MEVSASRLIPQHDTHTHPHAHASIWTAQNLLCQRVHVRAYARHGGYVLVREVDSGESGRKSYDTTTLSVLEKQASESECRRSTTSQSLISTSI